MRQDHIDEHEAPELTEAMSRAVGGLAPDHPGDLVAGAVRRGRRLRARRWGVAGGTTLAAAAAVTAASVFGAYLPTVAPGDREVTVLPGAEQAGGKIDFPDYTLLPRHPEAPPGKEPLTARGAAWLLKELVGGGTSGYQGQASPTERMGAYEAYGRLKADAGIAGAETDVSVQGGFGRDMQKQGGLAGFYDCDKREGEGEVTSCSAGKLPDGSVLLVYEDRSGLLLRRHADLLRPDGTRVYVNTSNGSDIEDGPVVAPNPPLSLDELRRIATSPRWDVWVSPSVNEKAKRLKPFKDLSTVGEAVPDQR
ncbi:hypothetical protein G5C51_13825 [Streptomyces sp. A7024]|uniref:Uncharacterized protein n=1 Tax=Streptomyces coryli TaxID=1128680 RepID=A0A6G4U159_9ACTN|nr:hypothetical protein [Streptomyces coryli]NGN64971.1 hypothetical protein [Streptomyces coryli]